MNADSRPLSTLADTELSKHWRKEKQLWSDSTNRGWQIITESGPLVKSSDAFHYFINESSRDDRNVQNCWDALGPVLASTLWIKPSFLISVCFRLEKNTDLISQSGVFADAPCRRIQLFLLACCETLKTLRLLNQHSSMLNNLYFWIWITSLSEHTQSESLVLYFML